MNFEKVDWADTAAVAAVIVAATTWMVTTILAAINGRQQAQRESWKRLQELVQVLYSGDALGVWSQHMAIEELCQMPLRRTEVLTVMRSASTYWKSVNARPDTIARLDEAILRLGG